MPKAKEVHFKTINDIYPCSDFLHQRFKFDSSNCRFCDTDIETVEHLFFQCKFVNVFWKEFRDWLTGHGFNVPVLNYECIKVGFILVEDRRECTYSILIILAKYFIHKCRFFNTQPQCKAL